MVITHLDPDILKCEVKCVLRSITTNKVSGGAGIPAELFKVLNDDAVKVLYSICQQIWKTQQWSQDWKMSVFIPVPNKDYTRSVFTSIPKKENGKGRFNYCVFVLISNASKVMLKILQAMLQQYVN